MAQIVIRNIDDAVLAVLRKRAAAFGTSSPTALARARLACSSIDREATLKRLDDVRRQIGSPEGESILDDLRRDRRRDAT